MPASLPLKIGDVVGSYRTVRLLGAGGMGTVYEAMHLYIERRAALKVLTIARTEPELATRFLNEARAANVISHPGIVQVFEYGQLDSGALWLLMEYIEGQTLGARTAAVRAGVTGAAIDPLSVLYQLATALSAAHARGVVHRDLKPTNIILTPDPTRPEGEQIKLLDFGIAKLMSSNLRLMPNGRMADPGTLVGTFLGTAHYMAPEQCRSAASVDAKADVYALGVIAYELLAGRLPFEGEALAIMMQKCSLPPPPLSCADQPEGLVALVTAMLQRAPQARPSMAQVAEELARLGGRGLSGAQVRKLVSSSAEHSGLAPAPRTAHARRVLIGSIGLLTGVFVGLLILFLGSVYSSCGTPHGPDYAAADLMAPEAGLDGGDGSADQGSAPLDALKQPELASRPDFGPAPPERAESVGDPAEPGGHASVTGPHPPACVPQPLRPDCIPALSEPQKQAMVSAAKRVGLRLCPGRRLTLVHPVSGFLRCTPVPWAPAGFCDRFISTLDALWDASWQLPVVVEVKCPAR